MMPQDRHHIKRGLTKENRSEELLSTGKSWFFGVGINQYKHFPNLNNAVKDVKDLIFLLESQYDLNPENVITLFDETATRRNIIGTFDYLVKNVGPQDKLLIYYSGHGHLNADTKKRRGFWIPIDAEKDHTDHYIRNTVVREYIDDIDSLHTLLISDSCFSGSIFVRDAGSPDYAIQDLARRRSRWAICSGRHDEQVFDGEPGTNSPFAAGLMYLLENNKGPYLNVAKVADEIVHLTRANYEQLPEGNPMYGVGHMGGQYVFSRKDAPQCLEEQLPPVSEEGIRAPAFPIPKPERNSLRLIGAVTVFLVIITALILWGTGAGPDKENNPPIAEDTSGRSPQGETGAPEETIAPPPSGFNDQILEQDAEKSSASGLPAKNTDSEPVTEEPVYFQYAIKGFIRDEDDRPLPDVKIIVEGVERGTTSQDGFFQVTWQGDKKKLIGLRYQKSGYRTFNEEVVIGAGDIDGRKIALTTLTVKLKKDNSPE